MYYLRFSQTCFCNLIIERRWKDIWIFYCGPNLIHGTGKAEIYFCQKSWKTWLSLFWQVSAVDTALQDVRTFTVNKASITKVDIFHIYPPSTAFFLSPNPFVENFLASLDVLYRLHLPPELNSYHLFAYFQVTVFLTSLTDGSSTGVTDGESVEGSVFIERIMVGVNPCNPVTEITLRR